MEEEKRRQDGEKYVYGDYLLRLMDRTDPNTAEGQRQIANIYQQWLDYKRASEGHPVRHVEHAPVPTPPSPVQNHPQAGPKYPPGLHVEPATYRPLSPLFSDDHSAARDVQHETFTYPRSAFSPASGTRAGKVQRQKYSWRSYYQHVAFYLDQPQLGDQIITDNYRASVDAIGHDDTTLAEAFSRLLLEQTVKVLVEPGHYRPGQGGSDEAVWGKAAVSLAELARVGRHIPHNSEPWGRMGMNAAPSTVHVQAQPIRHRNRVQNPYHLPLDFFPLYGDSLHGSVYRLILHMRIPVTSIVAAIWFLHGLPFHDGDGLSGHELRLYFRSLAQEDPRLMVKQALTLGLLLAGKWLDDNAYHNKTWCVALSRSSTELTIRSEMSHIPLSEIDRLEHLALGHYHYSLNLSGPAWLSHVSVQAEGLALRTHDRYYYVLTTQIKQMLDAAEESEAQISQQIARSHYSATDAHHAAYSAPFDSYDTPYRQREPSSESYHREPATYGVDDSYDSGAEEVDFQLGCYHERHVSALVDDDEEDVSFDDDGMSEFAEYDGAAPFITREHIRRSVSVSSSTMDSESMQQWRFDTDESTGAVAQQTAAWPARFDYAPSQSQHHSERSTVDTTANSYTYAQPQPATYARYETRNHSGLAERSSMPPFPIVTGANRSAYDTKGWENCPYF